MKTATFSKYTERGFTLIEVLVSVAILGIGLLGLAGLQLVGVKNSQGAYLRTQASFVAYDMVDRMRANPIATQAADYDIGFDGAGAFTWCLGSFGTCTPEQMADLDIWFWKLAVGGNLNSGQGSVVTAATATGDTAVTVTVRWVDPYSGADPDGTVTPEQLVITATL